MTRTGSRDMRDYFIFKAVGERKKIGWRIVRRGNYRTNLKREINIRLSITVKDIYNGQRSLPIPFLNLTLFRKSQILSFFFLVNI